MTRIQCPSCGAVVEQGAVRHAADEFCPSCDFPLFWAARDEAPPDLADDDDEVLAATVRRRPGAAGRQVLAGQPCPVCNELNSPRAVYCNRCGADMHPPPPPPPAFDEPEPAPAAPVPQEAAPGRRRWWLVGLVVLALLLLMQLLVVVARL